MTNKYTLNLKVNNKNAEEIYAAIYENAEVKEYRFSSLGNDKIWIVDVDVNDKNTFMTLLHDIKRQNHIDYLPFTNNDNPFFSEGFALGGAYDESQFLPIEPIHRFRTDSRLFQLTQLIQQYVGQEPTMEQVHFEAVPRQPSSQVMMTEAEIKTLYHFVQAAGINVVAKDRLMYQDALERNLDVVYNRNVCVHRNGDELRQAVEAVLGHAVHYYPDNALGQHNANAMLASLQSPKEKTPETILESYRLRRSHDIDALIVQMMAGENRITRMNELQQRLLPIDFQTLKDSDCLLSAYNKLAEYNFREIKDVYRDIGDKAFWVECLSDIDILLSIADENQTVSYQYHHAVQQGVIDSEVWSSVIDNLSAQGLYQDAYPLIQVAREMLDIPENNATIRHDIH